MKKTIDAAPAQFWDTSALVALVFQEPHTALAVLASREAKRYFAWDWMRVEAQAALRRRAATREQKRSLKRLTDSFQYVAVSDADYPAMMSLIEKHGLRAADAGHLFCLLQARKLVPALVFVCFDAELTAAAEAEGVTVFRRLQG